MARLGDVGLIITGRTPSTGDSKNYASNDICFIKPSDIRDNELTDLFSSEYYISEYARSQTRIVPPGSVLVTCIGIVGKVAINTLECAFNQQINAIIPNKLKCDCRYLAYALLYEKPRLQNASNAPVVPILNKSQFSEIEIPLPPLDEQRKIAAVLDKVSDLIAKRRQQLDKLDTLVKARFVEMFGDLQINNKNWGVALVGENCFVTKLAGFEYTNYIHYQDTGDVVMVKAQNVKDGKLNNKELSYISSDVSNLLPRSQLAAGDIVMTYVGANIGDVALIDDKHRYHLAPNVAKISPDKVKYDSVFFMHMLMMLRTYISDNSADTAKAALSMERIRNLSVFIPPMNLQRIFASFAEQVEKLKSIVMQNLEQLEMIKKSMLQQYFE